MQTLHIFIKNPRLGYVKTRLAATIGEEATLVAYRHLLAQTRSAAQGVGVARWLWYSDEVQDADEWPVSQFQKKVQPAGDLGQRMSAAFEAGFGAGANKSVIIGSDCPTLTSAILESAFSQLDTHDFVVGPTFDGGYYLLGMRSFSPELFENIPWSTEHVLPLTLSCIAGMQRRVCLLPTLNDIDTEPDWIEYLAQREQNR